MFSSQQPQQEEQEDMNTLLHETTDNPVTCRRCGKSKVFDTGDEFVCSNCGTAYKKIVNSLEDFKQDEPNKKTRIIAGHRAGSRPDDLGSMVKAKELGIKAGPLQSQSWFDEDIRRMQQIRNIIDGAIRSYTQGSFVCPQCDERDVDPKKHRSHQGFHQQSGEKVVVPKIIEQEAISTTLRIQRKLAEQPEEERLSVSVPTIVAYSLYYASKVSGWSKLDWKKAVELVSDQGHRVVHRSLFKLSFVYPIPRDVKKETTHLIAICVTNHPGEISHETRHVLYGAAVQMYGNLTPEIVKGASPKTVAATCVYVSAVKKLKLNDAPGKKNLVTQKSCARTVGITEFTIRQFWIERRASILDSGKNLW